jgi:hypothetical protein
MTATRYYPAYLLNTQEYDDAASCLDARSCPQEQAQEFIALARTRQSEIVVQADEDSFFVIAEDEGKWQTWAARNGAIRDTHAQATELMNSFGKDVQWRVFDLRQPSPIE